MSLSLSSALKSQLQQLYSSPEVPDEELDSVVLQLVQIIDENRKKKSSSSSSSSSSSPSSSSNQFTEKDSILIAYPNHIIDTGSNNTTTTSLTAECPSSPERQQEQAPIETLADFCHQHLQGAISTIHVLPFHPSVGYDGYCITDYDAVEPRYGSWESFQKMRDSGFNLMFDLVLNHCSSKHSWFLEALQENDDENDDDERETAETTTAATATATATTKSKRITERRRRKLFQSLPHFDTEMKEQLKQVLRARDDTELLHTFDPVSPSTTPFKNVWCTYHREMPDLNWSGNPQVLVLMMKILLECVSQHEFSGGVRLDAFGYTYKEVGASCVNHPKLKVMLKLIRFIVDEAGFENDLAILPSITNVTMKQCIETCFFFNSSTSNNNNKMLSYHLPLPGLLLHTLHSENVTILVDWLGNKLPSLLKEICQQQQQQQSEHDDESFNSQITLLNLSSTHDGIGFTWLRDILDESQRQDLISALISRGGIFKTRKVSDASQQKISWEVVISVWEACSPAPLDDHEQQQQQQQHIKRFLLIQTLVASLQGVPAFYLGLLLCSKNSTEEVERIKKQYPTHDEQELHCIDRSLNRGRFSKSVVDNMLLSPSSSCCSQERQNVNNDNSGDDNSNNNNNSNNVPTFQVLNSITKMMRIRSTCKAFHPQATQVVRQYQQALQKNSSLMCIIRNNNSNSKQNTNGNNNSSNNTSSHGIVVACLFNVSSSSISLTSVEAVDFCKEICSPLNCGLCVDLLSNEVFDLRFGFIAKPWSCYWLTPLFEINKKNHSSLERNTKELLILSNHSNLKLKMIVDSWRKQSVLDQYHIKNISTLSEHQNSSSNNNQHYFEVIDAANVLEQQQEDSTENEKTTTGRTMTRIIFTHHAHPLHKTIAHFLRVQSGDRIYCRCFKSLNDPKQFHHRHEFLDHGPFPASSCNNSSSASATSSASTTSFKYSNNGCPNLYYSGIDEPADPKYAHAFVNHVSHRLTKVVPDVILVSPFCRSLQSGYLIASSCINHINNSDNGDNDNDNKKKKPKIVAWENLRAMDNLHSHSRRMSLSVLKKLFPMVEFEEGMTEEDDHYVNSVLVTDTNNDNNDNYNIDNIKLRPEPRERIEARIRNVFDRIFKEYSGKTVLMVTHFSFLLSSIVAGFDDKLYPPRCSSSSLDESDNNWKPILEVSKCNSLRRAIEETPKVLGGLVVDTFVRRLNVNDNNSDHQYFSYIHQQQQKQKKQEEIQVEENNEPVHNNNDNNHTISKLLHKVFQAIPDVSVLKQQQQQQQTRKDENSSTEDEKLLFFTFSELHQAVSKLVEKFKEKNETSNSNKLNTPTMKFIFSENQTDLFLTSKWFLIGFVTSLFLDVEFKLEMNKTHNDDDDPKTNQKNNNNNNFMIELNPQISFNNFELELLLNQQENVAHHSLIIAPSSTTTQNNNKLFQTLQQQFSKIRFHQQQQQLLKQNLEQVPLVDEFLNFDSSNCCLFSHETLDLEKIICCENKELLFEKILMNLVCGGFFIVNK